MVISHKTVYDLASSRKELFLCPQPPNGGVNEELKMKNREMRKGRNVEYRILNFEVWK